MATNHTYFYIKLKDDFFNDPRMIALQGVDDGYKYALIYLKLILLATKTEGMLRVSQAIPYNSKILGAAIGHSSGDVERAFKALQELDLIEIADDKTIFIREMQNFIGKSSTNADRMRLARRQEKQGVHKCAPEIELEKELELETELDTELDINNTSSVEEDGKRRASEKAKATRERTMRLNHLVEEYNRICTNLPAVTKLTKGRKDKARTRMGEFSDGDFIACFEKANVSDWCTGKNPHGWVADWDWFMTNDTNIVKVLSGRYDNRTQTKSDPLADAIIPGVPQWED